MINNQNMRVFRDLAYVANGHERQKLDLYLPEIDGSLPLISWVHGGAFRMGSKDDHVPIDYLDAGYAVATINYRLSQHALFPAQIEAWPGLAVDTKLRSPTYHVQESISPRAARPKTGRSDDPAGTGSQSRMSIEMAKSARLTSSRVKYTILLMSVT